MVGALLRRHFFPAVAAAAGGGEGVVIRWERERGEMDVWIGIQ